jgi:hypothetical protein
MIRDAYPGSRIFPSRIQEVKRTLDPGSQIRSATLLFNTFLHRSLLLLSRLVNSINSVVVFGTRMGLFKTGKNTAGNSE